MSVILRGFGGLNVVARGYGEPVLGPLCWVEEVVEYANNPAAFSRSTLASKAPVMKTSVGVGTSSSGAPYSPTPLATSNPTSYTAGENHSEAGAGYSDDGDTYDAAKDCA